MKCPSLSLLVDFSLKSILLDIRIAIPACFLGLSDWKFFPPTLYSVVMSVFEFEVCLLYRVDGWILFCIQSVSLIPVKCVKCELSRFILRETSEQ